MEEGQKFHTVRGYQLLEQTKKLLTRAMEDYLEMNYRKEKTEGYIRMYTLSELGVFIQSYFITLIKGRCIP